MSASRPICAGYFQRKIEDDKPLRNQPIRAAIGGTGRPIAVTSNETFATPIPTNDPNFDWQIDVDPDGTNDGEDFDGTGSQSDDDSDSDSDDDG